MVRLTGSRAERSASAKAETAARARHDFYNGELMRNYISIRQTEDFVDRFCHYGNVPLLISGSVIPVDGMNFVTPPIFRNT